mgnify:CR=1 FL=1
MIAVFIHGWASEAVLREEAERHARALESIRGVRTVNVTGRRERRLWVEVDPLALERYGLALADVAAAVGAKAREAPLGSLETESGDWLLRVDAELDGADDLLDLPILADAQGRVVRLSDVAVPSDTYERWVTRARFNGEPCIHLRVDKEPSGDLIDISAAVREYVASVRPGLPEGVAIGTNSDLSVYVRNRLRVMAESGTIGSVLVLLSLVLVLNLRVAAMTALGIPISFLGGIFLAAAFGVTMNMMTMFALIVALGMIVDDAIVVGENIHRLMEEGMDAETAAVEGTVQVGPAVTATILTTIAAFLPLLVMSGTTGQFLRPLPLLVAFCLVVSLFEAIFVLPSHLAHATASRSAATTSTEQRAVPRRGPFARARDAYVRFLGGCLHWRYVTLLTALTAAFLVFVFGALWVPFHLFDDFESKILSVDLRTTPGTSLRETELLAMEAERRILELPRDELESVNLWTGVSALDATRFTLAPNLAQLWVELREGEARERTTPQIVEDLRERLLALPPAVESVEVTQPQSGPTGRALDLWLRGPDREQLALAARAVEAALRRMPGVRDVTDNLELGKREVEVVLRDDARALGLTETALGRELRASFEGTRVGRLRWGQDDVELIVKLPESVRAHRGSLGGLRVTLPDGARVPLEEVAELRESRSPAVLTRDDRERAVNVLADVNKAETSADKVVAAIREQFADAAERWPGTTLAFKGDEEDVAESLEGLEIAGGIALALIYMILGSLFRSFTQPVVIMFVIPFAAVGMIGGHVVMGRDLTLMSLIGLLALAGVVVNDSLIFVDFVNVRRREGAGRIEALLDAGRTRFRPIFLTTLTTLLGLSPLTFFVTGQARFLQPMAISFFFGLGLATLLVLVLVPCAYLVLDDILLLLRAPRERLRALRAGPARTTARPIAP